MAGETTSSIRGKVYSASGIPVSAASVEVTDSAYRHQQDIRNQFTGNIPGLEITRWRSLQDHSARQYPDRQIDYPG